MSFNDHRKNNQFSLINNVPLGIKVSFEFFPPKNSKMNERLWFAIQKLAPLSPIFVSVTYGAGGSTRKLTHETVVKIQKETDLTAAAHLTCVSASKEEVDDIAKNYWDAGIRHIVALRGDPPNNQKAFIPHPNGYKFASDLVLGLKKVADFEISVAAYPEKHIEAHTKEDDLDNLKRKIDNGATRAITQFFFDPDIYLRFRDDAQKRGISVPIVPGLMPITNFEQNIEFAKSCGADVPKWLLNLFKGVEEDDEARKLISGTIAVEQVRRLVENGVNEFHFYTLNRPDLTFAICRVLGIKSNLI